MKKPVKRLQSEEGELEARPERLKREGNQAAVCEYEGRRREGGERWRQLRAAYPELSEDALVQHGIEAAQEMNALRYEQIWVPAMRALAELREAGTKIPAPAEAWRNYDRAFGLGADCADAVCEAYSAYVTMPNSLGRVPVEDRPHAIAPLRPALLGLCDALTGMQLTLAGIPDALRSCIDCLATARVEAEYQAARADLLILLVWVVVELDEQVPSDAAGVLVRELYSRPPEAQKPPARRVWADERITWLATLAAVVQSDIVGRGLTPRKMVEAIEESPFYVADVARVEESLASIGSDKKVYDLRKSPLHRKAQEVLRRASQRTRSVPEAQRSSAHSEPFLRIKPGLRPDLPRRRSLCVAGRCVEIMPSMVDFILGLGRSGEFEVRRDTVASLLAVAPELAEWVTIPPGRGRDRRVAIKAPALKGRVAVET